MLPCCYVGRATTAHKLEDGSPRVQYQNEHKRYSYVSRSSDLLKDCSKIIHECKQEALIP
jgi:hypothetical protein